MQLSPPDADAPSTSSDLGREICKWYEEGLDVQPPPRPVAIALRRSMRQAGKGAYHGQNPYETHNQYADQPSGSDDDAGSPRDRSGGEATTSTSTSTSPGSPGRGCISVRAFPSATAPDLYDVNKVVYQWQGTKMGFTLKCVGGHFAEASVSQGGMAGWGGVG